MQQISSSREGVPCSTILRMTRRLSNTAILSLILTLWALCIYTLHFIAHSQEQRSNDAITGDETQESSTAVSSETLDAPYDFQPSPPWAIFYNLFVRPEQTEEQMLDMVSEQFEHISNSHLATLGVPIIYYSYIGTRPLTPNFDLVCKRFQFDCRLMGSFESEVDQSERTLQRTYEYCGPMDLGRKGFVYLHSGFNYHKDSNEALWRRHLTSAAASSACLEQGLVKSPCHICGLIASAFPAIHFIGNMFAVRCAYVRKLIPPLEFKTRMRQVAKDMMIMILEGKLSVGLGKEADYTFGLDEYAMEHWMGSHPSVKPCDVSNSTEIFYWRQAPRLDEFQLGMFPRVPLYKYSEMRNPEKSWLLPVLKKESWRKRELFFLPGLIFKWIALYNKLPPQGSWTWKWFPDGQLWRDETKKLGVGAIEKIGEPFWKETIIPVDDDENGKDFQ
jgi:hypothetical protein